MGEWSIYGEDGQVKATVKKREYNGEFMGERSITATLYSPSPINLSVGDYLTYRNEVFSIDYDPSILKQSRNNTYGQGYVYDSVKFSSRQMELVHCKFLDYVIADNQVHYSSLPTFSFYCETITALTERIQANLNRLYTGANAWTITVNAHNVHVGRINIDVQGMTCWDALGLIADKFKSTFIIRGRSIEVAPSTDILPGIFQYGKDKGLRSILKTSDPSQGIVTRLRAMGNTTNMPHNWYYNKDIYLYAPITEVIGPHELTGGADIHTTYDFNSCFTVRVDTSSGEIYRTKVSLDKVNWAPCWFTANPGWVGYSVASVMKLPGYDPDAFSVFMEQLSSGLYNKLYFKTGLSKDKWPSAYKEYTGTMGVTTGEDRLMLPDFPDVTTDPYIDSTNIGKYGIREESVIFDGSNGLEDIYPTIQGMTAEEVIDSGTMIDIDPGDNGHLDEIVSATQIRDNGIPPVEGEAREIDETFEITLKDIGFNIEDYLAQDYASISMRDGKCEGREFQINEVVKSGNKYILTCARTFDDSLNRYFPYNDYNLTGGDKFALLNIEMPDIYIEAAAKRLEDAAKAYLSSVDHAVYVIEPKIDNVKAKRNDDDVDYYGVGTKIYDTIYEGMMMHIDDEDLNIFDGIFIDKLTIKEGESIIPQYEVVLRNEKAKSTIQQMQQQISDIKSGGAVDEDVLGKLIKNYTDTRFIHKDKNDWTKFLVDFFGGMTAGMYHEGGTSGSKLFRDGKAEFGKLQVNGDSEFRKNLSSKDFVSGFTAGKGWAIMLKNYINAAGEEELKSYAEFDNLVVRGTMRVFEFIVSQMLGENDNRTFTAMMEVDHYDPATGKVYLDTQDGKLYNPFRVDDVIVVQQYQPGNTGIEGGNGYVIKSYELVITEVGVGDLSDNEERLDWVRFKNFVTTMEGVFPRDLITQHDTFVRIDNLSDPTRKGIVQMMTVGENTPYMDVIYGAKTDPNNKLKTRLGNLEGIYNHLFGWLHEWGMYAINTYLVGELKIAHTGTDMSNRIEMTANSFSTNYRALEFNIPEQENFFGDPSFTDGLWTFGHQDTEFFMTGSSTGELIYMNRNLYASDDQFVGLVEHNGRMMLRICNSYVKLDSLYIREAGSHKHYLNATELANKYGRTVQGETWKVYDLEQMAANYLNPMWVEEWDTMYLAFRFICRQSGSLQYGFKAMTPDGYTWYESQYHPHGGAEGESAQSREIEEPLYSGVTVNTSRDTDFVIEETYGTWDGVGDFWIYVDGEIYLDFVTFTNKPLDSFKSENSTMIEQDAYHIGLMAQRTVGNTQNIARLTITADMIEAFVGEYLDGELTLATLIQQTSSAITLAANNYTDGKFATLSLTVDGIAARVTTNEGDISTLEQTATSLTTRISNAEGDISTLEQTATSISSRITSEVNGLQSQITQTADTIELQLGYEDSNGNWVWASEITQEIEDTVDGKISTITIRADQVNIDGSINLDDAIQIDNGEVSFHGDMHQGFDYGGTFYEEVEISRGYGTYQFYSSPHIELNDVIYTSGGRFNTVNYCRITPNTVSVTNITSYGGETTMTPGEIEVTDSAGTVTIQGDRIIISDGTHTKTITATS